MISEILAWWGRQLISLLPVRVRQAAADFRPALTLKLDSSSDPGRVDVLYKRSGRAEALGQFLLEENGVEALRRAVTPKAAGAKVDLEANGGLILQRELTFPLAVDAGLDEAIRYEFDHETPFSPDEVYWSAEVLKRDRENARLSVRLAMILKSRIDVPLERLQEAGIRPFRIVGDGAAVMLRHNGGTRRRLLPVYGAALVIVLLCALPFLRQSFEISSTERRIAALEPDAQEARTLRRRLGDDVREQQAALGDPLTMLASLTDLLPDDTSLTGLSLHDRDLELVGQSSTASMMLSRLANHGGFQNPSFSAPVTRNPDATADTFSIKVRFVQ